MFLIWWISKFWSIIKSTLLLRLILGMAKHTQSSFSVTWSFWKLIPNIFSLLYCEWLIISELEKSNKVKFWMLLNYKGLVKWHGTSSYLFTKLDRILFLLTSRMSPLGMQSQTNWTLSCQNSTIVCIQIDQKEKQQKLSNFLLPYLCTCLKKSWKNLNSLEKVKNLRW